jgi:hypothetical protein
LGLVVALTSAITGCSHSSTSEPPVVSAASSGPPQVAVTYVTAFATDDPDLIADQMISAAAANSPAGAFAEYQRAVAASDDDVTPLVTNVDGQRMSACTDTNQCTVFADFVVDSAGLLQSFTVDGTAVDGLVKAGGPPQTAGTATARVVGSLLDRASQSLNVALELVAGGDDVQVDLAAVTLLQDGQPSKPPTATRGDGNVPADTTRTAVVTFASGTLGGTLTVTVSGAGLASPQTVPLAL